MGAKKEARESQPLCSSLSPFCCSPGGKPRASGPKTQKELCNAEQRRATPRNATSPVPVKIGRVKTHALLSRKTFLFVSSTCFPANTFTLIHRQRVLALLPSLRYHRPETYPSSDTRSCPQASHPSWGCASPTAPGPPATPRGIWPCQVIGNERAVLASPL